MSDETMVEYPRFCTLIVGREAPEGPCGKQAIGVYQCIGWNSYRFVGTTTDVGMEVATNKPVSLCAGHRESHTEWPVIAEFSADDMPPDLVGPVDVPCGHTAMIDDVQHQCVVVGQHVTIELAVVGSAPAGSSPVHTDGPIMWNDDGEMIEQPNDRGVGGANPQSCGEAIVVDDVTHTCMRQIEHDDDHSDNKIAWNEDGDYWPVGAIPPKSAPRGGGKPRR